MCPSALPTSKWPSMSPCLQVKSWYPDDSQGRNLSGSIASRLVAFLSSDKSDADACFSKFNRDSKWIRNWWAVGFAATAKKTKFVPRWRPIASESMACSWTKRKSSNWRCRPKTAIFQMNQRQSTHVELVCSHLSCKLTQYISKKILASFKAFFFTRRSSDG